MRRLNSETINLWRYLGGFPRIARTFEFRKRNSIEKFSMGVTVEVDQGGLAARSGTEFT